MLSQNKPNIARPWLKYYDKQMLDNLKVPECTMRQYLYDNMPGLEYPAISFYDTPILWKNIFDLTDSVARSLRAIGFKEGDQVPVLVKTTPEFFSILLACESIGASLLIRENDVNENADSIRAAGVEAMIANDSLSKSDMEYYLAHTNVKKVILLPLTNSCERKNIPEYEQKTLDSFYDHECASGDCVVTWDEFLEMGNTFKGEAAAETNIDRPLFRCYTSGSTGPSKQVIHSAHTIIGALTQMNFYGSIPDVRPTWLVACLPPSLVSVVISFLLLPLASNKLLILDPFCDPKDIDLQIMKYKPNCWPSIPMFCDIVATSKRIPKDYDMSHLFSCGAGCEHLNNLQLRRFQKFLNDHNCKTLFTAGYGSSEAGSNVGFCISGHPMGNGNVGVPMPLTNVAICKPGTTEELCFNETGEICLNSPNVMLGYDNPEATKKALRVHADGKTWLHTGDVGYINEDGVLYTKSRGSSKRFGGGFLDILPMENTLADANIDGIVDQFFANVPDKKHDNCFIPYLFVVLEDGYTVEDVREQILAALPEHQKPAAIMVLDERPYWHFKTHRIRMIRSILGETNNSTAAEAYPSNMF